MERLADYVAAEMAAKRLSTYEISRRSGGAIAPATVTRLLKGTIEAPSLRTLEFIAKGLGVPRAMLWWYGSEELQKQYPCKYDLFLEPFGLEDLSVKDKAFLYETMVFLIDYAKREAAAK